MKIAPPAEVKPRLNAYVDHVAKEYPVVITRNRKPVALLLPLRDSENLDHLVLAHSPRFQALLDGSRASVGAAACFNQLLSPAAELGLNTRTCSVSTARPSRL